MVDLMLASDMSADLKQDFQRRQEQAHQRSIHNIEAEQKALSLLIADLRKNLQRSIPSLKSGCTLFEPVDAGIDAEMTSVKNILARQSFRQRWVLYEYLRNLRHQLTEDFDALKAA